MPFRAPRRKVKLAAASLALALALLAALDRFVFPLPVERLSRPHARFVYSRDRVLLASFTSRDSFWRAPVPYNGLSPRLIESVLAVEDRWFRRHPGVNPVALLGAAWDNLRAGRVVRGGSTITMQIARMMEPKERTVGGKVIEMLRAVQLEEHYCKDELLEIYFNLVPYGGNIEGVGAAAHFYFDKPADRLTWSEAAILTAIPASPNTYRPDLHPEQCRARRDLILRRLHARGVIDAAELARVLTEEIPPGRQERPFVAPHFCQMLATACPDSAVLRSTLDFDTQLLCVRLAARFHGFLAPRGIHNLAIVVLDNTDGSVLALVGSPDFTDRAHHGQVNGAVARRSPGSALKPFVYALGFDDGLITPRSLLDDIPVAYAGYSPESYDEQYHGVVSASNALVNSFNVPAVNLAYQVGLRRVHALLNDGGLGLNRKYYEYGLPLVLGACEVSLLDLAALYSSFARGGRLLPPSLLAADSAAAGKPLVSPEAAWLTTTVLADLQRPDFPASWEFTRDRPAVAWKTGTSYGRKDAWAIGYNPCYTVGVWTGNFSGAGSPYLVGAETAAPLMFEIFDALMRGREPTWFARPAGIELREVCAVSGMPASADCPATVTDFAIRDRSPVRTCTLHRRVLVDHATGHALCRACAVGRAVDTVTFEEWPARVTGWLLTTSAARPIPDHNPQCTGLIQTDHPVIASPESDRVYELRPHVPRQYQKIPFRASIAHTGRRIHWFLDHELFATSAPGDDVFYDPEPGPHTLMVVDDFGRSSTVSFVVQ